MSDTILGYDSTNQTKTPEEKAREILSSIEIEAIGFYIKKGANQNTGIDRSWIDIYTEAREIGYHSRDEEVKELREALKECIENIEANVNHSEGFFNALMNATVFCEQAKQLLKEE